MYGSSRLVRAVRNGEGRAKEPEKTPEPKTSDRDFGL